MKRITKVDRSQIETHAKNFLLDYSDEIESLHETMLATAPDEAKVIGILVKLLTDFDAYLEDE